MKNQDNTKKKKQDDSRRKRPSQFIFRMTESERKIFDERVERSQMSAREFIIHACFDIPINIYEVKQIEEITTIANTLMHIGTDINEIAHAIHRYDIPLDELVQMLTNLEKIEKEHSRMLEAFIKLEDLINEIKSEISDKEDNAKIAKQLLRLEERRKQLEEKIEKGLEKKNYQKLAKASYEYDDGMYIPSEEELEELYQESLKESLEAELSQLNEEDIT